jgi:hypothetical protein
VLVADLLPDSRAREAKGSVRSPIGNLIPGYCANCGIRWGMVPENDTTFLFVLCQPCADSWGPIAHTYVEPDAVFYERVHNAQLEQHGRPLTVGELTRELEDPSSTLARLADEWRAHVRKVG